jgi:hypothetical protein
LEASWEQYPSDYRYLEAPQDNSAYSGRLQPWSITKTKKRAGFRGVCALNSRVPLDVSRFPYGSFSRSVIEVHLAYSHIVLVIHS